MYFFPTASPSKKNCSWLSHTHILKIQKVDKGSRTEVVFSNKQRIILNVSYGSFENQLHRTAQYRFSLNNRMERIHEALTIRKNYLKE